MSKIFNTKKFSNILNFISILIFVLYLPLIRNVNFMQNDDWNRTTSVERFLHGDFSLISKTATTFYLQGIPGMIFSKIFGIQNLPILTLIFSILCLNILIRIINEYYRISNFTSYILGLLLFFNPLFVYSIIGFMTENYLLLYFLLGLYFFLKFENTSFYKYLILSDIFIIFATLTKQSGLILVAASIPYFLIKKKFKLSLIQFFLTLLLLLSYFFIFPITTEMQSKGFLFKHLLEIPYTFSLVYGALLVLTSFTLPLCVFFVFSVLMRFKTRPLIIIGLLASSLLVYAVLNLNFQPGKISWEEYPYFENTFERTGFLPRTILGTKYQFMYNFDIYHYWDLSSRIFLSLFISSLFLFPKKIINLFSIIIAGYLLLMIFTETFFDRYLLILLPVVILFILEMMTNLKITYTYKILLNSSVTIFIIFLAIFTSQMALDFIFVQHYIWEESGKLVTSGIPANKILATGAWKNLYGLDRDPLYIFSFDSPQKNPEFLQKSEVIEEKQIIYPLNWFIDPKIYLYKININ